MNFILTNVDIATKLKAKILGDVKRKRKEGV